MGRMRNNCGRILLLASIVAVIGLTPACNRSESLESSASAASTRDQAPTQTLPFHEQAEPSPDSPAPGVPERESGSTVPFRGPQPRTLPSGSLVTVELQDSLSTARVHAGDSFHAVVAAPVIVDGATVIKRGASVMGTVEGTRAQKDPSGIVPATGYVRLSLVSLDLAGKQVSVHTSSLFARGSYQRHDGIGLRKGRALTFRLISPVRLIDSASASPVGNTTANSGTE